MKRMYPEAVLQVGIREEKALGENLLLKWKHVSFPFKQALIVRLLICSSTGMAAFKLSTHHKAYSGWTLAILERLHFAASRQNLNYSEYIIQNQRLLTMELWTSNLPHVFFYRDFTNLMKLVLVVRAFSFLPFQGLQGNISWDPSNVSSLVTWLCHCSSHLAFALSCVAGNEAMKWCS